MNFNINSPEFNDNRNYNYSESVAEFRREYKYFIDNIIQESSVLDLGSGDGTLLELLRDKKKCKVRGIELSTSGVAISVKKGLHVSEGRIDTPLEFADQEFDYAICNTTLQMVSYPETLLQEMLRIGKKQIISFPNFAFYRNRFQLLFKGQMPRHCLFGYEWYNTGHIHQLSIKDFYVLLNKIASDRKITMINSENGNLLKDLFIKSNPNLFQVFPVFLIERM